MAAWDANRGYLRINLGYLLWINVLYQQMGCLQHGLLTVDYVRINLGFILWIKAFHIQWNLQEGELLAQPTDGMLTTWNACHITGTNEGGGPMLDRSQQELTGTNEGVDLCWPGPQQELTGSNEGVDLCWTGPQQELTGMKEGVGPMLDWSPARAYWN